MPAKASRIITSVAFAAVVIPALQFADLSVARPGPAGENSPPAIGAETFKERRQILLDSLGDGTAVLYSQGEETETGYRADGNFWYLTGVDEEGAILLLSPGEIEREVLLLPSRDPEAERWSGMRPALTESLTDAWGFDRVVRTGSLDRMIVSRMKHAPVLHLISSLTSPSSEVPRDLEYYNQVADRIPGVEIENSSRLVESMRMIKSADEIAAIEKAIAVTHKGITDLLASVRPGINEFQLDATLEASFKRQGAQHMAFEPIVGAGEHTTIIHYQKRNRTIQAGELLLLDVGAEWDRYAADISRTIPVDGHFTDDQAEIYDIVFEAQKAAIAAISPGVTAHEINEIARDVIRRAGYIDDFMHGTSHHLGLDVHDVADKEIPLAPGMVITVEPGIYLPDRGIGVRIEDDVLVTKDGHRVLSAQIPRERTEVETWLASARK